MWQSILQELLKHGHGRDDRREKVYCLLGKKVQPEVYNIDIDICTHPTCSFLSIFFYQWWTLSRVIVKIIVDI